MTRLFERLMAAAGPISPGWLWYIVIGFAPVGALSLGGTRTPTGINFLMFWMFVTAGFVTGMGIWKRDKLIVQTGLIVSVLAAWCRAALLLFERREFASRFLAPYTWVWITVGVLCLFAFVARFGVKGWADGD